MGRRIDSLLEVSPISGTETIIGHNGSVAIEVPVSALLTYLQTALASARVQNTTTGTWFTVSMQGTDEDPVVIYTPE